jgi:shikimate kinase
VERTILLSFKHSFNAKHSLFLNKDPEETLEKLMLTRAPLYEEIADITIMTDNKSLQEMSKEIQRAINEH